MLLVDRFDVVDVPAHDLTKFRELHTINAELPKLNAFFRHEALSGGKPAKPAPVEQDRPEPVHDA